LESEAVSSAASVLFPASPRSEIARSKCGREKSIEGNKGWEKTRLNKPTGSRLLPRGGIVGNRVSRILQTFSGGLGKSETEVAEKL